ncbi:MAG TPA: hypothetical protein PLY56_05560, partial [Armatimonadota bacterium]|nr:hypothetical protein [Armatimonadota bacterium]
MKTTCVSGGGGAGTGQKKLRHNLTRGQVPGKPRRARRAEGAPERASHLGRHANGTPLAIGEPDAFDRGAIREAQEVLRGAIRVRHALDDLWDTQIHRLRQSLAQGEGEVGHLCKGGGSAAVDPIGDLAPAEPGMAQAREHILDGRRSHADKHGSGRLKLL